MIETPASYVFQTPEGSWKLTGSRVSLDAIVCGYWDGQSVEAIAEDFPTLSLEQIHGAIAFYLRNRDEIDRYLAAQETKWEQFRQESEIKNAPLLSRLRNARRSPASKGQSI